MKGSPGKAVRADGTKGKILDAAETLFGREGFHRTSLRAITSEAGVNLAAVNYHFGTKDALLREVFSRRLTPLNKERTELLKKVSDEARKKGKRPRVEDAMRAFMEPTFRFRVSEKRAGDLVSFIGRSIADPDSTVRNVFIEFMRPIFRLLFETVSQAMPDTPKETLYWRLQFALGAFVHTMHMYDKDLHKLLGIPVRTRDEEVLEALIRFISTGMESK